MDNSQWVNYTSSFVYNLIDSYDIVYIGVKLVFDKPKPEISIQLSGKVSAGDVKAIVDSVQKSIYYKMQFDIVSGADIKIVCEDEAFEFDE